MTDDTHSTAETELHSPPLALADDGKRPAGPAPLAPGTHPSMVTYSSATTAGELPPLDGPAAAKARLAWTFDMAAGGKLPGSVAGSMARCIELWLKAHDQEVNGARIRQAERTIKALEAELAKVQRGAGR